MKLFSNGPLPENFENESYISLDGNEFALPSDTAKLYMNWCTEVGLKVLGFDVWLLDPLDSTIFDDMGFRGGHQESLKEVDSVLNSSEYLKYNRTLVFSIKSEAAN